MKIVDRQFQTKFEMCVTSCGNKFTCAPIGHSVIVQEHYLNVKIVLQKLRYSEHNWAICVDFKMVNFWLRQQGGTPNILVFLLLGQSSY